MEETIDVDKARELKELIEKITHTGRQILDPDILKYIINLCNLAKVYIECAYEEVENYLKEKHSEVRFSSVQLIDELFGKYAEFRSLVLGSILKVFVRYSTGIGDKDPLPPPKKTSEELFRLGLSCIDRWTKNYGEEQPGLKLAVHHLERGYNVDFTTYEIVDKKTKAERVEMEKRMLKINKERLKKINGEMEELKPEIDSTLVSIESCFNLLLPSPDDFNLDNPELKKENSDEDLRLYGILHSHQSVTLHLELDEMIKIKEDEDNSAIIETARECFALIKNRFLPKTEAWVELITKAEGGGSLLLKSSLALLDNLQAVVEKYKKLEIIPLGKVEDEDVEAVSSDSDLEEVTFPKPDRKTVLAEEVGFFSDALGMGRKQNEKQSQVEKIRKEKPKENSQEEEQEKSDDKDRKSRLLEIAPKLPYDVDLYHWEDDKLPTPTLLSTNVDGRSVWATPVSELGEIPLPGGSDLLRSRVIEFSGKWEPVNRACKAPLPSGKLCPRHDRLKCPFHGLIVDRDDEGKIINKEDEDKVAKSKSQIATTATVPDWQDPKLLAELKASTGLDLKIPEKGKRLKKKNKYPGLTDITPVKSSTPSSRIAKKIFSKKSVKRVAATLDKLDHKRHRDKFGDQFNYVHDTS